MADERAEARLAAAAVHLLGERRRARAQAPPARRAPAARRGRPRRIRTSGHEEKHRSARCGARSSTSTRSWSAGSSSAVSSSGRSLTTSPASPSAASSSAACARSPAAAGAVQIRVTRSGPAMARAAASATSSISSRLVAATRSAPAALSIRSLSSERSCWRMRPGHPRYDEAEQHDGGRTDDREVVVPAAQVVDDADRRRDQRRAREQTETESRQQPAGLYRGLIDLGHRGMEGGGAPEQVEADPAGVEPDLVVVRALHEHQAVDEVRGQQADDAGDHQVEGQAALAPVQRQPHRHRQQQHVGQRVRHRHQSSGGRQRMVVDVGGDQPHP